MVSSNAVDVDAYLAELPEPDRAVLSRLRDLCRDELAGFEEVMAYGMPGYRRDGVLEVAFARQKRHVSVYLMREDVTAALADRLADQDMGRGCLRFRSPGAVDLDLVRDLLRATAATRGPAR
ncbi:iron chaperone [Nocardiopsis eucommiae]|uniref:iron chaperone n=1 Tax=Nocardiopsis eucommiae TaxID=2831970 RepID=UPI003D75DC4A